MHRNSIVIFDRDRGARRASVSLFMGSDEIGKETKKPSRKLRRFIRGQKSKSPRTAS